MSTTQQFALGGRIRVVPERQVPRGHQHQREQLETKEVVFHHSLNTVGGVEVAGGQHRVLEVSAPWGLVFFGAETSLEVFVCVWEFA